jgi:hypothetical protein
MRIGGADGGRGQERENASAFSALQRLSHTHTEKERRQQTRMHTVQVCDDGTYL